MPRSELDDARMATLADYVGLDLSAERRGVLTPALNGLLQQFDLLDDVDVGETPSLHAFDPRWGNER